MVNLSNYCPVPPCSLPQMFWHRSTTKENSNIGIGRNNSWVGNYSLGCIADLFLSLEDHRNPLCFFELRWFFLILRLLQAEVGTLVSPQAKTQTEIPTPVHPPFSSHDLQPQVANSFVRYPKCSQVSSESMN